MTLLKSESDPQFWLVNPRAQEGLLKAYGRPQETTQPHYV